MSKKIIIELTKEEGEKILGDLNIMLRSCDRPYPRDTSWPKLSEKEAIAWNKIFRAITGHDHHEYTRVFGKP